MEQPVSVVEAAALQCRRRLEHQYQNMFVASHCVALQQPCAYDPPRGTLKPPRRRLLPALTCSARPSLVNGSRRSR